MDEILGVGVNEDVDGMRDESIHISDVMEVLTRDYEQSTMYNGGAELVQQQLPGSEQQRQQPVQNRRRAEVKITEQPAQKALRFRYECEGRSAGSIPGASSTPENKTFPSIQVCGFRGRAVVVVSCVTKDPPYRPHPHNLVGREGCKKGVCTLHIPPETMSITFSNLGIQCVKKKDIESALRQREEVKVDPFSTGFKHRTQPTTIDLNVVRLCFQVFLEGDRPGKYTVALPPVVSDPIYDKKAMSELSIVRLSHCVSCVDGSNKDIILLCEKVAKEDIQIRFFEKKNDQVVWQDFAEFQPSQVHKQTAIWFKPPAYCRQDITEPVKVFIQLHRPSDGAVSEALPFEYLPLDAVLDPIEHKRKRPKTDNSNPIFDYFGKIYETDPSLQNPVKIEPRDKPPSPYDIYGHSSNQNPPPVYRNPSSPMNVAYPTPTLPPLATWPGQTVMNIQHFPETWIATSTSNTVNATNDLGAGVDTELAIGTLLDMDNQELGNLQLNSGDLPSCDTNNLSASFSANLSLTDLNSNR